MAELFIRIVNASIAASWLVLAIVILRFALKKAPKWVSVLLWGFVAIRLICPFSIETGMSIIPSSETISPKILIENFDGIETGIDIVDSAVNPIISQAHTETDKEKSGLTFVLAVKQFSRVWAVGVILLTLYTAVSYFLLRQKVATAVLLKGNVFQSENVVSPFVLGIIKPKIYLPFHMDSKNLEHVIAHEEAHIRRKDHLWKPLGFLLLTIHWFNPIMWLGYILLCRDIELACDEKVIKEMDNDSKADYTEALVACSVNRRSIAACPLAFGEVGVKERVKSVMNYKKPAFWIMVAAIVTCLVVAVCFLTDPKTEMPDAGVINGNMKTYCQNDDGTWQCNGRNYQYRLVITGRMHNAASDSTFVYLSNIEKITFDQAWRAAGYSSNSEDYFHPDEAVLVELGFDSLDDGTAFVKPEPQQLDPDTESVISKCMDNLEEYVSGLFN